MSNNKQQTAVEWLAEQMLYPEFANPYIEQAKEMEKEQKLKDFQEGYDNGYVNGQMDLMRQYNET
jgi:hypothetical protein